MAGYGCRAASGMHPIPHRSYNPAPSGWLQMEPYGVNVILGAKFPDTGWDPMLKAANVASAFARKFDQWKDFLTAADLGPLDEQQLKQELVQLWRYKIKERDSRADEIRTQAADFTPYFALATGSSVICRPNTWALILAALQVGGLVGTHFKMQFKRARPVQVWPAIAPNIATPAHPSFPSGHALQSRLIALAITDAAPAFASVCDKLAFRIGQNREVAGVHWPSDTRGSEALAGRIWPLLKTLDVFVPTFEAARHELGEGTTAVSAPSYPAPSAPAPAQPGMATAGPAPEAPPA